jgi:hypothetical protein
LGRSGGGAGAGVIHVERAADADEVASCDVSVDLGGSGAGMAEEFLDVAEVGAGLEEVGREGSAARCPCPRTRRGSVRRPRSRRSRSGRE